MGEIRRKLGVKKVGHAGTLDPLADGVLIVLTGKMTKQQDTFMHQDKEYVAKIAFGFSTVTYDLEGEFISKLPDLENPELTSQNLALLSQSLKATLQTFEGDILQKVPAYSAVKISGKRLYDLARSGKSDTVEIPVKKIKIHKITLLNLNLEYIDKVNCQVPVATIKVECGSGTYIRSLAFDLGEKLGVPATLSALTRTRVGDFLVENSIKLENLENL